MARFLFWLSALAFMGAFFFVFINRTKITVLLEFDRYLDTKQGEIAAAKVGLKLKIAEIEKGQAEERAVRSEAKSNSYSNPRLVLQKEWLKFKELFWSAMEFLLVHRVIIYAVLFIVVIQLTRFIYYRLRV